MTVYFVFRVYGAIDVDSPSWMLVQTIEAPSAEQALRKHLNHKAPGNQMGTYAVVPRTNWSTFLVEQVVGVTVTPVDPEESG